MKRILDFFSLSFQLEFVFTLFRSNLYLKDGLTINLLTSLDHLFHTVLTFSHWSTCFCIYQTFIPSHSFTKMDSPRLKFLAYKHSLTLPFMSGHEEVRTWEKSKCCHKAFSWRAQSTSILVTRVISKIISTQISCHFCFVKEKEWEALTPCAHFTFNLTKPDQNSMYILFSGRLPLVYLLLSLKQT